MGFSQAVKSVFSNYANFSGRARRSEYWYFVLFSLIIGLIPIVNLIVGLISIIPGIAVCVRRLHDIGKSGWWLLLGFIPIAGPIVLLVWFCTDSQPGENQWGANPKGE
ncbi:MAG: DUF805 domain-containing protein [Bacteroidaceae bacterium]|nr:DUF805 domain-containing protein [Bacteroidaceae bacterium]MBQ3622303.1 DUF805 domain-containing protein [Bacteroidaceae bacterium]